MIIVALDEIRYLRLDLYPPTEPGHDEWIEYQVTVGRWRSSDKLVVGSDPLHGALYLDAAYAPEVPELCDAIDRPVRDGTVLEGRRNGRGVLDLRLLFSDVVQRRLPQEWRGPFELRVSDDAAQAFASGLRLEMDCLARGVPPLR